MPDDDPIKRIPINQLHQEPGAHELPTSPDMEPYLRIIMAHMQGGDTTAEMEALRQLPLEKRLRLAGGFSNEVGTGRF
jgi:hypothetical protein